MKKIEMGDVAAYACDVGSVRKGNFGWARVASSKNVTSVVGSNSIDGFLREVQCDIENDRRVAIGMECPMWIPVPDHSDDLGRRRQGEENKACFATAGAVVAMSGLQQLAFILKLVQHQRLKPVFRLEEWKPAPTAVLFWEAFVAGKAHSDSHVDSHVRDAATAVTTFFEQAQSGKFESSLSAQESSEVFSLAGCALLWAGWSENLELMKREVVVVKPDQPYRGPIEAPVASLN